MYPGPTLLSPMPHHHFHIVSTFLIDSHLFSFIRDILQGKKKHIKQPSVKVISILQYNSLSLKEIATFVDSHPQVINYFPI